MKRAPFRSRVRARLTRLMFELLLWLVWLGRRPRVAAARALAIEGPGGPLPLRVYTPQGTGPFPVMLYLHGGGWVIGSVASYDALARHLCHETGSVVVTVDYRLAPEHRFPAALDDCRAALDWVHANCTALGGDPRRIVLAGDSAGGNLTAVCAALAHDAGAPSPAGQVLVYPVTGYHTPPTPSYAEPDKGRMLSRAMMVWFFEQYLPDPSQAADPRACPLRREDLSGLPPALVITAQHDPLRDEGIAYARRLAAAGVPVRESHYAGEQHGFVGLHGPTAAHCRAIAEIRDWLRSLPG
jgi:acetyl esterase